ncbi:MAG TPA: DUF4190 domain-containing protein [Kofleriaceae bacterium]|jgi:hypothetical protein|nr:DUF4190 domain-containing protein [Kofleriaceae bacterium]
MVPQARAGQWFWRSGEHNHGPVSLAQLQAMARGGQLAQDVTVWTVGLVEWVPADRVPVLFGTPVASPADDGAMHLLLPVGPQSGLAIAAGYCGLIGVLVPLIGPIGLILGIYALRDLKQHPEKRGRGRALTGIILGGLGSALWLLLVVASVLLRR